MAQNLKKQKENLKASQRQKTENKLLKTILGLSEETLASTDKSRKSSNNVYQFSIPKEAQRIIDRIEGTKAEYVKSLGGLEAGF